MFLFVAGGSARRGEVGRGLLQPGNAPPPQQDIERFSFPLSGVEIQRTFGENTERRGRQGSLPSDRLPPQILSID